MQADVVHYTIICIADAVSTAASETTSMAQSSESISRLEAPAIKRSRIDDCCSDVSD